MSPKNIYEKLNECFNDKEVGLSFNLPANNSATSK